MTKQIPSLVVIVGTFVVSCGSAEEVPLRILGLKRIWNFRDATSARAVHVSNLGRKTRLLKADTPIWALATSADVARELAISSTQKKQIYDARVKAQREWTAAYRKAKPLGVFQRRALARQMNAKRRATQKQAVQKTLTPRQITRLEQLRRQGTLLSMGPIALRKEMFAGLKLAAAQQDQLFVRHNSPHRGGVVAGTLYDKTDYDAILAIRKALVRYEQDVMEAVLTQKQLSGVAKLLKPKFDSRLNNTAIGATNNAAANKELLLKHYFFRIGRDGRSAGWGMGQEPVVGAGPNGSGLPSDRINLASLEPVWGDLALSPQQRNAITQLRMAYQTRAEALAKRTQHDSTTDWVNSVGNWEADDRKKLAKALSPRQLERLEKIRAQVILQNEGLTALRDNVFSQLKITEQQHKEMSAQVAAAQKPLMRAFRAKTWAGTMARLQQILNEKQLQLLKRLLGPTVVQPPLT